MTNPEKLQHAIDKLNSGDKSGWEELLSAIYAELRVLARHVLRGDHSTIQATDILNNVLAELLDCDFSELKIKDPKHFSALVSRKVRQRLFDHMRKKGAQQRGGDRIRFPLESVVAIALSVPDGDMIDLHLAIEELSEVNERYAFVCDSRLFCGKSNAEIAQELGISEKAVQADWTFCKAWLRNRLGDQNESSGKP